MTQKEALLILKTGSNVFLTGNPGSGKTHTVNQYVDYLRACGVEPAITASTGIAATHIGGLTIHAWSGIGVRQFLTKVDKDFIGQNKNITRRVGSAHVLIIDEISMLSARVLSMIDDICCEVRQSGKPFGGLQVVLVGDFFQLPPVSKKEERTDNAREEFAYKSDVWNALNPAVCYLSDQHRQEDPAFLEFLSAIRDKRVREAHIDYLRTRYARTPKSGVTQLYSHNIDVDAINTVELAKLTGQAKRFEMTSRGPEKLVTALKRGCLSPEMLTLKIGTRVMFTKNDITRHQYANGTLGTVSGFSKQDGNPVVKTLAGKTIFTEPNEWHIEDGGRVIARITQFPLRLAWAMTVHKSQGMSLDAVHMDLSQTFEYGQGYVALSRVRTLAGLSLAGLNTRALEVHPDVCAKDVEFRSQSAEALQKFSQLGEKKLATLHNDFIRLCGGRRQRNSRFKRTAGVSKKTFSTFDKTYNLLKTGKTFSDIARERNMTHGTIVGHVEKLITENKIDPVRDLAHIQQPNRFYDIKRALELINKKDGRMFLAPARALLGNTCSYDDIRLVRLFLMKSQLK